MKNTKKALITGGTRGIGRATAHELKKNGYDVWITGTTPSPDSPFHFYKVDFSKQDELEIFLRQIGDIEFSVVINNASTTKIEDMMTYSEEDFRKVQDVNLIAPYLIMKQALKAMVANDYGRILNVTSIFSMVSRPGRTAYSASKSALAGLTRSLALEVAQKGVVVNCLAPGFVMTELVKRSLGEKGIEEVGTRIPLGRLSTAEEMARYAYFLVSEENTYMTGQTLVVDGGYTCE